MFRELCDTYLPCVREIGGGSAASQKVHGTGCLIGPTTLITARHVLTEMRAPSGARYPMNLVYLHDGAYRAELAWELDPLDLAILRIEERVKASEVLQDDPAPPRTFPRICDPADVRLGSQLCYLSRPDGRPYFAPGFVASTVPMKPGEFVLSGTGTIEHGYSGSPVFAPDGRLAGVITASAGKERQVFGRMPVFSLACIVRDAITKLVQ